MDDAFVNSCNHQPLPPPFPHPESERVKCESVTSIILSASSHQAGLHTERSWQWFAVPCHTKPFVLTQHGASSSGLKPFPPRHPPTSSCPAPAKCCLCAGMLPSHSDYWPWTVSHTACKHTTQWSEFLLAACERNIHAIYDTPVYRAQESLTHYNHNTSQRFGRKPILFFGRHTQIQWNCDIHETYISMAPFIAT